MQYAYPVAANNPQLAGSLAGRKVRFGDYGRYAVAPLHTRFADVTWFVFDAEVTDEVTGFAAVIRQDDSFEAAVAGL